MKKFIILLFALVILPVMADAQIVVKDKNTTETLLSIRMGFIALNCSGGSYYLAMSTTNKFDRPMILPLGKDKDEACATIESLIEITTTIGKDDCVRIESAAGEEFRIYRFAKNTITINADGYAAASNTSKAELNRILDKIMSHQ